MSWSRRVTLPLLTAALLLPSTNVLAQEEPAQLELWTHTDDGRVFASAGDPLGPVPILNVELADFPPAFAQLPPPPAFLYGIGEVPPGSEVLVTGLHNTAELPFADPGETPVYARAIGQGNESTWARDQHILSVPQTCLQSALDAGYCVYPGVLEDLVGLSADPAVAAESPGFLLGIGPGLLATLGTVPGPGTLVDFAGDSTVMTDVAVKPNGKIVVRGTAEIGPGYGGKWRGFDATLVEITEGSMVDIGQFAGKTLADVRKALAKSKVKQNKPKRVDLRCPDSGQGYVIAQYLVNFAPNATAYLGDDVKGGAPVVISDIVGVDCGAGPAGNGPVADPSTGPAAALVCASMASSHVPFTSSQGGASVTDPSSISQRFVVATIGVPPAEDLSLTGRLGDANGGDPFSVRLEAVQLDSPPTGGGPVFWVGETQVGITSYGPKPIRRLDVANGFGAIDLLPAVQDIFGNVFRVNASEDPVGTCPGGPIAEVPARSFPDGFDLGGPDWYVP